ncbi:acyltransferase [Mycobacterium intracellulare]|uniref:acyltransferase family protein n=1 Tax=Mycobacterium intracellulare TaxID=1767 RepID=UPI000BB08853|nr:acyltransferase [Mycobacterium intracellulare]PBA31091.1 acyltransferase [Mycobacterium intracellulare]
MKLGQAFDTRNNALNAWRLVLAISVIVGHSFTLTGHEVQAAHYLAAGAVDGFFAVSGFLITASWLRQPHLREYLAARALRILPAYYVCLVVTAFIIAPVGVAIQGGAALKLLLSAAPFQYVLMNIAVATLKVDVGGTPTGIPYPGTWNSSLWTLMFELGCYLAVAGIGLLGLGNRRWVSPAMLALAVLSAALLPPFSTHEPFSVQFGAATARFAIMFAAGALLYQWRDVIPARWWLVGVSVVVVLLGWTVLPHYRMLGGIPLAYAIIVSGALIRNKLLRLRTDLSYGVYIYAFPIQQLLIICAGALNPNVLYVLATICTLPLAAASWFLIEKPAMSLKRRLKKRWSGPVAAETDPRVSEADTDRSAAAADIMAGRTHLGRPG